MAVGWISLPVCGFYLFGSPSGTVWVQGQGDSFRGLIITDNRQACFVFFPTQFCELLGIFLSIYFVQTRELIEPPSLSPEPDKGIVVCSNWPQTVSCLLFQTSLQWLPNWTVLSDNWKQSIGEGETTDLLFVTDSPQLHLPMERMYFMVQLSSFPPHPFGKSLGNF